MQTRGVDVAYQVRHANAIAAARHVHWAVPALLAAIGCFALATGILVYVADRDAAHAMLLPRIAALGTGPIFGTLGPWMPSFVHPFAFSLFSAAALQRRASPAFGACAAWWAVNMAFEVGQHSTMSGRLAELLQFILGRTGLTRTLSNYFVHGSFDVGDMVAVTAGTLAAAGVLYCAHELEARHAR